MNFAFNSVSTQVVSIKGTITPVDAATSAWVLSGTNTLEVNIDKGPFEIPNVRQGTYQVIIETHLLTKTRVKKGEQ